METADHLGEEGGQVGPGLLFGGQLLQYPFAEGRRSADGVRLEIIGDVGQSGGGGDRLVETAKFVDKTDFWAVRPSKTRPSATLSSRALSIFRPCSTMAINCR